MAYIVSTRLAHVPQSSLTYFFDLHYGCLHTELLEISREYPSFKKQSIAEPFGVFQGRRAIALLQYPSQQVPHEGSDLWIANPAQQDSVKVLLCSS